MRNVFYIPVEIEVHDESIAAATDFMPWFQKFINDILDVAENLGYTIDTRNPSPSLINGGISKYYIFQIATADKPVKVILSIRFSTHESKLSEEKHVDIIKEAHPEEMKFDPDVKYIDVIQKDVPYVDIRIGNNRIKTIDGAFRAIAGKLLKIANDAKGEV